MPKRHLPCSPEFRRQMVELVRAGRSPVDLAREHGSPRVDAELQARGQKHSRKRIARLMREARLVGACWCPALDGTGRRCLRQRHGGELLLHSGSRAAQPMPVHVAGRGAHGLLQHHRRPVQFCPPAFQPGLALTHSLRNRHGGCPDRDIAAQARKPSTKAGQSHVKGQVASNHGLVLRRHSHGPIARCETGNLRIDEHVGETQVFREGRQAARIEAEEIPVLPIGTGFSGDREPGSSNQGSCRLRLPALTLRSSLPGRWPQACGCWVRASVFS